MRLPKDRTGWLRFVDAPEPDPKSASERGKKYRGIAREVREKNIAILDMETDPFDSVKQTDVKPFLAVLYSDNFEPVVIWDENFSSLVARVIDAIMALPEPYTIYAHNGGRFDFMFLIHSLRGEVSFKGRGIMEATIIGTGGTHRLRDSFHIIPEKLASYQKDAFQYEKNLKAVRHKYKAEIIRYCINDCKYLLDIVRKFIGTFGLKLSIGQAAMYELKQHYEVKKFSEGWDEYMRTFFFGGRVECLQGRGLFKGAYKLYDVNSMYPFVMATMAHPIGDFFDYELRAGEPNADTCFIDLECDNRGALIKRTEDGATSATVPSGNFLTTIHEYRVALKYKLISNVRINWCVDCKVQTNFAKFVEPLYAKRIVTKGILERMKKQGLQDTPAFLDIKKDDIFYKLILNNAYGKFAQNPRRFREHYITSPDEQPSDAWLKSLEQIPPGERTQYLLPSFESASYWIYEKPAPGFRFNNVGTAASITGAARAVLLEALQHAVDPIYCDTDSIICKSLPGHDLHKDRLGAWDLEDEFSQVIIDGKKLYSCWFKEPRKVDGQIREYSIKSKGVSGLHWRDMLAMLDGAEIKTVNRAPTLTRFGDSGYMPRIVRATAANKLQGN